MQASLRLTPPTRAISHDQTPLQIHRRRHDHPLRRPRRRQGRAAALTSSEIARTGETPRVSTAGCRDRRPAGHVATEARVGAGLTRAAQVHGGHLRGLLFLA